MRLRAGLLACAVALGSASAAAQTVTPIPPAAPAPTAPQIPALQPPKDLSGLACQSIASVSVVLDGNIWEDVQAPAVKSVKTGDTLTPALARRGLDELLASGQFARGRVAAVADKGGVAVAFHLVPRKLVTRIQVDLHGARLDFQELLHAADLTEGGELVSAEIDEIDERVVRFCATHGFPSAHVDIRTRTTDDPSRTLVLVDVQPGAARVVDELRIYPFGADEAPVLAVASSYAVKQGD